MPRIDGFRPPYPTEGPIRRALYNASDNFLAASGHTEDFFNRRITVVKEKLKPASLNILEKGARTLHLWGLQASKFILVKLAKHDYIDYHQVDGIPFNKIPVLKHFKFIQNLSQPFSISTPGLGAKLILYYLGLLGPRTYRAWERGLKEDGTSDFSEIKDVLRRDAYAITVFVFGLGLLSAALTRLAGKNAGVKLFNSAASDGYSYSEQEIHAKITNPDVLAMHYHDQYKGIKKALSKGYLSHNIIPAPVREKMTPAEFETLTSLSEEFKSALKKMAGTTGDELKALAVKAFQPLQKMDEVREAIIQKLKAGDAHEFAKLESKIAQWPEYSSFLAQYAKHYRAPLDLTTFVIIILALGYFPVWWNGRENQKAMQAKLERQSKNRPAVINPIKLQPYVIPMPSPFGVNTGFQPGGLFSDPAANTFVRQNNTWPSYPQAQVAFSAIKNNFLSP